MRAVALRVNEVVGLAGFVVPGMRVDVLMAGNAPSAEQARFGTLCRTILQNIEVLSAGQKFDKTNDGKPESAQVVNLLVTPSQAEILNLAMSETKVQLVLRNPLDNRKRRRRELQLPVSLEYLVSHLWLFPLATGLFIRLPVCRPCRLLPPSLSANTSCAAPRRSQDRSFPGGKENRRNIRSSNREEIDDHSIQFHAAPTSVGSHGSRRRLGRDWHEGGRPISKSDISVSVNGSTVLDQPIGIRRISIANPDIAEAVAVSTNEIVVNGKTVGDTSLIVWDLKGSRCMREVHVLANSAKIDTVRAELLKEAGADVTIDAQEGTVFLNGTVANETAAVRALNIASTMGKVVNLLRVNTPAAEPQILLKVRFADIDRAAASQFGINLFTMSPTGIGTSSTGQFGQNPTFSTNQNQVSWNLSSLLNIFYFRPDINLGAVLQDLETKNVLQILAEPNLLTLSGKSASFLAGGEFPFPTIQGGASGVGQITIQFKEFGIRLNFLPVVTPRGTIRLTVTPEVSSLDYANGLSVSGYTVPGLATRRVQTDVELENGQSFVIAGLLNNQVTDELSKMPGLSSIPLLGKLFQSRSVE